MSVASSAFQCATAPGVVFSSRETLHEHYKSEWHRYNLRRRAAGLAPIAKEVFDKVRQLAAQQEASSTDKQKKKDHVANKNRKEEHSDEEEETQQEAQEPSQEEPKSRPVTLCLFCPQAAETLEDNLLHMHKTHGFVLHDLDSVIDLPRLVQYVSDKINIGMLCLTCEREFRSPDACKSHMEATGHSKIPWEYEDEIEEFLQFYQFKEHESTGATMEIDSVTGELILRQAGSNSVKKLGPGKEFRTLYKQVEQFGKEPIPTSESEAQASAVLERSLQIYRGAGVLTTTSALSYEAKTRLAKRQSAVQERQEKTFHEYAFRSGYNTNWLIKHRKAGTNRGVGHGVHG
ncbi:hypothetical protein BASA81_007351 [Batrachochytrium salamandrivorans]|nr:hypothetical protein BASA81_007351 [Batrachochytrium salamandrivorans]